MHQATAFELAQAAAARHAKHRQQLQDMQGYTGVMPQSTLDLVGV